MGLKRKKKRKTTQPHTRIDIAEGYEKILNQIDKAIAISGNRKSPLVPLEQSQLMDYETWDAHTPNEHKFEFYDGKLFSPTDTYEADRLLIALTYYTGLRRFAELLPGESRKELQRILNEN